MDHRIDNFETDRLGRRRKTCLDCKTRRAQRPGSRIYPCPHGRQCHSRCRDCLGHPINQGHCSRCHLPFDTVGDVTFNGKPLQTCLECRYYCKHGLRGQKECEDCRSEKRVAYNITRQNNVCTEHGRRADQCIVCNPNTALAHRVRRSVYQALTRDKMKPIIEYLGCSIDTLRLHLEQQFEPGMTWDNYGSGPNTWQIDHITPIKYPGAAGGEPTIEEVSERLHWTNCQPMWTSDNIAKGNRFIGRKCEIDFVKKLRIHI